MKTRLIRIGLPLSIAIHLVVLAIPLNMAFRAPARTDEKKVTLLFEKTKLPAPHQEKPKPKLKTKSAQRLKIESKAKPAAQNQREQLAEAPLSPIEAEVDENGGIDIPSGPAYEEVYIPPPPVPAPAFAPPAEQPPPPVDKEKLKAEYRNRVFAIIQRNKNYPPLAKRRGIQGAAGVAFAIRADGAATDVKIIKTSGFKILDDAAVETIVKIGRFPPPPPEIGLDKLEIGVSIVFRLE